MSRIINGEGPVPCAVMLIGQRPGATEIKLGRPFCGDSGLELDRYLAVNAGLSRSSVFVTNLVRDYDGDDDITPEEIERDWPALMAEIEAVAPRYIGLVGLYAARAFLGPDIDMEWSHGLAFPPPMPVHDPAAMLMPLYHPAAGLHQPSIASRTAWDFTQFGRMVAGDEMPIGHLADEWPEPYYTEQIEPAGIAMTAGVDTEGTVESPWCLSYSVANGCGTVVRGNHMRFHSVILHNALHDLPVLERIGAGIGEWTDTMLKANLLGTEPLGLKALARRHAGMVMRSYDELMATARQEMALEYLSQALDYAVETERGNNGL